MAERCGGTRRNLSARTVTALALALAPAALGANVGPCPPQASTAVQEVGEPVPTACLLDDRGGVQAALYPPSQRHPTGRVRLGNGSAEQIELGPGDLLPGLAPSFDRLRPDTLARIRARVSSAAAALAPADVATGEPPAPSVLPRAVTNERILARYEYDWRGRVRTKIGDEGIRRYVYDGDSDRVLEELDENGIVVVTYVWAGERLVSIRRPGQTRYPLHDGLGSVTGLTDEQGAVAASYHLDAWGNYRFPQELQASHNRFGFTGYYFDSETDLYYAKARYFDPNFGRFLTQDSYLGQPDDPPSLHRYFYANANPLRYVDLTGHAGSDAQARHQGKYRGEPLVSRDTLGEIGIGISVGSANVLLSLNSPGHMAPAFEQEYYVQPQTRTELIASTVTEMVLLVGVPVALKQISEARAAGSQRPSLRAGRAGADVPAENNLSPGQRAANLRESSLGNGTAPTAGEKAQAGTRSSAEPVVPAPKASDVDVSSPPAGASSKPSTFRDSTGRLRNADGSFAPEVRPAPSKPKAKGPEPPQLARGKRAHKEEPVRPGEIPEHPTPSGGRMDRYDPDKAHIREIKPNNPKRLREGQKQVEGYRTEMEEATGRPHTTEVTPYDPKKYEPEGR